MNLTATKTQVQFLFADDLTTKLQLAPQVYALLEASYRDIGGISLASGFASPRDMAHQIPAWRLVWKDGQLASVMAFKDSPHGLKMVAYALADRRDQELKRDDMLYIAHHSWTEVSDALLLTLLRTLGDQARSFILDRQVLLSDRVTWSLDEFGHDKIAASANSGLLYAKLSAEFPDLLPLAYVRDIGGKPKLKMLLGRRQPAQTQAA